jgi:hypothetical protein
MVQYAFVQALCCRRPCVKATCEHAPFCAVYGNLPTTGQLTDWEDAVMRHSAVPEGVYVSRWFRLSPKAQQCRRLSQLNNAGQN